MDQIEVDIVKTKALERGVNALLDTVVPGVVQLGGHPDLFTRDTRLLDTLANLCFVAIGKSTVHPLVNICHGELDVWIVKYHLRVNVTVSLGQGNLHGLLDLVGLGLPGTQTDGRNLGAGVEGESPPVQILISFSSLLVIVNYAQNRLLGVLKVRHLAGLDRIQSIFATGREWSDAKRC